MPPSIADWTASRALLVDRLREELEDSYSHYAETMRAVMDISAGLPIYGDLGAYVVLLRTGEINIYDASTLEHLDHRMFDGGDIWLEDAVLKGARRFPALYPLILLNK